MKQVLWSAALVVVAAVFFFGVFEVFPRIGWVDPSLYTAYNLNIDLYQLNDINSYRYQGSRLGFIMPLHFFSVIFNPFLGRAAYCFAHYLAALVAMAFIARYFVQSFRARCLLVAFVALNPLFISGLVFGGPDGAAMTYTLLGFAMFLYATQPARAFWRDMLAMGAGLAFAGALSAHVFAIIPLAIIMVPALYLFGTVRTAEGVIAGGAVGFVAFCLLSWMLGMNGFYLLNSMEWAKFSLTSSVGEQFRAPFPLWIKRAIFWLPIILAAIAALVVKLRANASLRSWLLAWACRANLLVPFLFFVIYDRLLGGDLLGTPYYFNLAYPVFLIGLVMLVGLMEQAPCPPRRRRIEQGALVAIGILALVLSAAMPYTRSVYKASDVGTKQLAYSQLDFVQHVIYHGERGERYQFIYRAPTHDQTTEARLYTDYYRGKPRYFDYLDSLAFGFAWDNAFGLRIDTTAKRAAKPTLDPWRPLIILGRDRKELNRVYAQMRPSLGRYRTQYTHCYTESEFPWCYMRLYRPARRW